MTEPEDTLDDAMPTDADPDLERLDAYLDGQLDPTDVAALTVRLAVDPELADTLAELRRQRADRQSAFAALEPATVDVDRFAWRVRGAVAAELNRAAPVKRSAGFRLDPWNAARFAAAAAACVTLGFLGGRLGRPLAGAPTVAVNPAVASVASRVDVPITDEYGRVVARQSFDNADTAQRFSDDLRRAHADGPPSRLVSETRY